MWYAVAAAVATAQPGCCRNKTKTCESIQYIMPSVISLFCGKTFLMYCQRYRDIYLWFIRILHLFFFALNRWFFMTIFFWIWWLIHYFQSIHRIHTHTHKREIWTTILDYVSHHDGDFTTTTADVLISFFLRLFCFVLQSEGTDYIMDCWWCIQIINRQAIQVKLRIKIFLDYQIDP